MPRSLMSRRQFAAGVAATGLVLITRRARAADFEMSQYHGQPESSPLHRRLVEMWAAVEAETGGRVLVRTYATNNNLPGGDPVAFRMLQDGEIEFYTLMGGIVAEVVPPFAIQGIPFAFQNPQQVYRAMDGALGDYLREEARAKGIYAVPRGCFENGMRQISCTNRPIRAFPDMQGLKIRVPNGEIFTDFFTSLGATPVGINSNRMYQAIQDGTVEAQENPLAIIELFKLYEIQKYVSMTNHMWSGFNLLANLRRWESLPADIRQIIERNVARFVPLQRADNDKLSDDSRTTLARDRGMIFNDVEMAPFRAPLAGFYARWKDRTGTRAWSLLEAEVGRLG